MPIPKPDEISPGTFQIGSYTLLINRCPFDTLSDDNCDFFMVLLAIREDNGYLWNINLATDPRFLHFTHLSTFERKLTNDDLVEYNHHVGSVFQSLPLSDLQVEPTFHFQNLGYLPTKQETETKPLTASIQNGFGQKDLDHHEQTCQIQGHQDLHADAGRTPYQQWGRSFAIHFPP